MVIFVTYSITRVNDAVLPQNKTELSLRHVSAILSDGDCDVANPIKRDGGSKKKWFSLPAILGVGINQGYRLKLRVKFIKTSY